MERLKSSSSLEAISSRVLVDDSPTQPSSSVSTIPPVTSGPQIMLHEAPHAPFPLKPILPAAPSSARKRRQEVLDSEECSLVTTSISPLSPSPTFEGRVDLNSESSQSVLIATPTSMKRNVKEPRRPSLACNFCRERKIGCGRPPEDAQDRTCK